MNSLIKNSVIVASFAIVGFSSLFVTATKSLAGGGDTIPMDGGNMPPSQMYAPVQGSQVQFAVNKYEGTSSVMPNGNTTSTYKGAGAALQVTSSEQITGISAMTDETKTGVSAATVKVEYNGGVNPVNLTATTPATTTPTTK